MQLTGALSNHDGGVWLRQALDGKRLCVGVRGDDLPGPRPMRPAQGAIQSAVLQALRSAQAAVGVGQIHRLVEDEFGRPVSRDTVASAETQPHKCLVSLRLSPSGRAALALCRLERVV